MQDGVGNVQMYCSDSSVTENNQTHKVELKLVKALEKVRRAVYLSKASLQKRSQRPNDRMDIGDDLLSREYKLAMLCKEDLESQLAEVKRFRQRLKGARDHLAALIRKEKRALGLSSEIYSGTVVDYPPPHGPLPNEVVVVDDICAGAADLRAESERLIEECLDQLKQQRADIRRQLKQAQMRSREIEVCT